MKGDDGTVASIALYVVQNVLCGHPFGVVAGNKVPHYDLITPLQPPIFAEPHHAVRRSEEVTMYQFVGFLGIDNVGNRPMLKRSKVIERVISYLMTGLYDTVIQVMIPEYVLSDHEEGGFDAELVERI